MAYRKALFVVRAFVPYQALTINILLVPIPVVMRKGYFVTPLFRFLTSSGEWVWQQVEVKLRYKNGTSIPHFWEGKIKVLG